MKLSRPIRLIVVLFFSLQSFADRSPFELVTINEVLDSHEDDAEKVRHRYKKTLETLFTEQQKTHLEAHNSVTLIDQLLLHDAIKFHTVDDLIAFSEHIQNSGFAFKNLEEHIITYLKRDIPLFKALEKAIERQKESSWNDQAFAVIRFNDHFMKDIEALSMTSDDYEKIRRVYALCINSWRSDENRIGRLAPKICEPIDDYKKPKFRKHPGEVRTSLSRHPSAHTQAYTRLIAEAQKVITEKNLGIAEQIVMAKCVAEKNLEFFVPFKSPRKSLIKLHHAHTHSKEKAFFSNTGVCLNFSGIAYNFARDVGLENHIHLAERHLHSYLEVEIDGAWFHAHPFNSEKKGCDLTHFGKAK